MKNNFLNIVILFSLILLTTCKDKSTNPNHDKPPVLLDTTSHDFIWKQDTLGKYPSFLEDVFVINKNDIWATGQVWGKNDTTYNAAH